MTIDLKKMNRKELEKLKSDVDKALGKVTEKEMKEARAAAEKAVAAFGLSLDDVTGTAVPKKARSKKAAKATAKAKGAPKFRNPANADQTWTGKGRQPEWFKAEVAKGTDPAKMAI